MLSPGSISKPGITVAFEDVFESARHWRLWLLIGWREVVRRYRRTSLGPFWTTASCAMFIVAIGFMYSAVWNTELAKYLPYLCAGFIIWMMISNTVSESCSAFISMESLLRQVPLPYTGLIYSVVVRNLLVTAHHVVIFLAVVALYPQPFGWVTLMVIPGVLLWMVNAVWIGLVLAIACARFRDVQQIVSSVLQVAMFVTPILYPTDALLKLRGEGLILVLLNPLYHYVEVIRAPMLGHMPAPLTYQVVIGLGAGGTVFALWLLSRMRSRIVFWL